MVMIKVMRSPNPLLFFSKMEKQRILEAIKIAEKHTSAEMRVHLSAKAETDLFHQAKKCFESLGMTKTKGRNGVLFFFCVRSRQFVVLGDEKIHQVVSEKFWQQLVKKMSESFLRDRFAEGMAEAIREVGEQFRHYFPHQRSDTNELQDKISFSKS